MPFLASLLSNGFTGLVAWLGVVLTKRLAVGVALGAFLVAGWVALQVAMYLLWISLDFVVPASLYVPLGVALYLLPSNTAACLEAVIVAKVAVWVWREQRDYAKAISFIT